VGLIRALLRRDVCWGFILMDSSEYEGAVGVGEVNLRRIGGRRLHASALAESQKFLSFIQQSRPRQ
jgi:hypothetical protein